MGILWTIIIGFIVGVIAKLIMPGDKTEPKGFIMTGILGIVGAFVATFLGHSVGWYAPGESAGILGGIVGAVIVLFVSGLIMGRHRATWNRPAVLMQPPAALEQPRCSRGCRIDGP